MSSPARQVSMKRTLRSGGSPRRKQGRSLDMDVPLQYSPSRRYGGSTNTRLSGQTYHSDRIPAENEYSSTSRSPPRTRDTITPTIGGPNPAHDGETDFETMPEITGKKSRGQLYLTKAQKYRLRLKNHFLAMIGEYVGTVLFLFFAFGGAQVANVPSTSITGATTTANAGSTTSAATAQAPNTSSLQFIALSFGFSLTVNAWVFFRISGG